jgi:predicted LPLAT superfamily acyltransferase
VSPRNWLDVAEAGGIRGIRLLVMIGTWFGRTTARVILWPVALYYTLFRPVVRRASRDWWRRVGAGQRSSLRTVFRHLLRFSQVTLDRMFLIRDQAWRFEFRMHGERDIQRIRNSKSGVLFLGAHLGSFEALCLVARDHDVPVNVVGYFKNARMINEVLRRLNPEASVRLIEVDPTGPEFIFAIRDRILAGEHVALLGDRVGLGGPTAEVEFFGGTATFPLGPYLLASVVGCPVCLFFALYREPNRYDVHCEWFADRVEIPRGQRTARAAEYASRFASRLEAYARLAPDNWFNFFDFWTSDAPPVNDARR